MLRKSEKAPPLKNLPPTDCNALIHFLRVHGQCGKPDPPIVDICACGWEMKDGVPMPAVYPTPIVPPELLDVVCCQCGTHTLAGTAAEELASRVPASVRVIVEKDARTVIRIVNMEKMRMKRTVPIWINNMMRLKRSMMASLVHMWRTKTMKLTFLNDTTCIQA